MLKNMGFIIFPWRTGSYYINNTGPSIVNYFTVKGFYLYASHAIFSHTFINFS